MISTGNADNYNKNSFKQAPMMRKRSMYTALLLLIVPFCCRLAYSQEEAVINKQGIELGEKKQFDKAIKQFDKAIQKVDNAASRLYHNKAWSQQGKGDIENAMKNYEEALRRNPRQIPSGENLGYLYYQAKDYDNAVRIGEQVLQYDPDNREVKKWLPDAYLKRLEQRRLLEQEQRNKELEEERQRQLARLKEELDKQKKETRLILVTLDFMIRTGYYFNDKRYKVEADIGALGNIPETIYISFTPTPSWEIDLTAENPFLGALTPTGIVIQTETIEGLFKLDNFMLGLGVTFTQYRSDAAFYTTHRLWDVKAGIIFGYRKDDVEMRFTFYPRLIPYDGPNLSGTSLDIAMLKIDYTYYLSPRFKFYSLMHFKDFFVFNHTLGESDYWGVYDIGFGATLGRISRTNNIRDIAFSLEFILRFYLRNLENGDPYTRGPNGQGYFGLSTKKWLKGDVFPGYRALNYVFGFRFDEEISDHLFLYQKFIVELCDLEEDHHEFNFQFGLGVSF